MKTWADLRRKKAPPVPKGWKTVKQIAALWGNTSLEATREKLRRLSDEGVVARDTHPGPKGAGRIVIYRLK